MGKFADAETKAKAKRITLMIVADFLFHRNISKSYNILNKQIQCSSNNMAKPFCLAI